MNKAYITLAICFIIASCAVYAGVIALYPHISDATYYNLAALYRLLFVWGATYLTFYIERQNPNNVSVWFIKWLCVYITGFQAVRLAFNIFGDTTTTPLEIGLLILGAVVCVPLSIKHWRDVH